MRSAVDPAQRPGADREQPWLTHTPMDKENRRAEYEELASFRYALRQFLRFSEEAARAEGITPQQHQALLAIAGFPARDRMMISELAEHLQLRHHSAVELINRLEANGLVAREPDTVDRRRVLVSVTPKGDEVLTRLSLAHREELRRAGPQLNRLLRQLTGEGDGDWRRGGEDV